MRSRSLTAAIFTMLMSMPATAEIKTLAQVSGWKVKGGVNDDGISVCNISANIGDSEFSLVLLKKSIVLHIQLFVSSWRGEVGGQVPIELRFDDKRAWKAKAIVVRIKNQIGVDFFVNAEAIDGWLSDFKHSGMLILGFPNNRIDDWHANLTGTKVMGEAMENCVAATHEK